MRGKTGRVTRPSGRWVTVFLKCQKKSGTIRTKQKFGSVQLHIEWAAPTEVKGSSQGRGNSGVFLAGLYEVQVQDNYDNLTYPDGQAGSLYGYRPPRVNATRPPGEWQAYDIIFEMPEFKDGKVVKKARITVLHNGVVVQHGVDIPGMLGHKRTRPTASTAPVTFNCRITATRCATATSGCVN